MRRKTFLRSIFVWGALIVFLTGAAPALAERSEWTGGHKEGKHHSGKHYAKQRKDGHNYHKAYRPDHNHRHVHRHFNPQHRVVINNYYVQQWHSGYCPPGLTKKKHGCVPPGHAKKWSCGRPLPPNVVYYDLPPAVLVQLGPPPTGHKFVRVAQDILMIAVGSGMVIDAIEDIGRVTN